MERRLGRGLGSLLGSQAQEAEDPQDRDSTGGAGGTRGLPIQHVRPNPNQPRKVFDSAALEVLRDSIKTHGVLQPICVRPDGEGRFEIVAGERRWRAARLAGLREIPATVLEEVDDQRTLELALVENVQRADLDPIEKARAFRVLVEDLGLTQEQVAARVGMKRSTVANHIRLLDLPSDVQDSITAGLITMGHAKLLLGRDPKEAKSLLSRTVREDLSVRQLEALLKGAKREESRPSRATRPKEPWTRDFEGRLREKLGAKVQVQNGAGYRGRIVIEYTDREELERVMNTLAPGDRLE